MVSRTPIQKIVIVGGGTAGWLTAAIIAAHHKAGQEGSPAVSLVESSDIPTVGVGEGTWPTMKNTMQQIGIREADLFRHCHAGFKQGGKFVEWVHGNGDYYYHPFTVPLGYGRLDLAPYVSDIENYAEESNFQQEVCEAGLAPRTLADSEYSGQCNYAYHVDAGALGDLLKNHCRDTLGVEHVVDTVTGTVAGEDGAVEALKLENRGELIRFQSVGQGQPEGGCDQSPGSFIDRLHRSLPHTNHSRHTMASYCQLRLSDSG